MSTGRCTLSKVWLVRVLFVVFSHLLMRTLILLLNYPKINHNQRNHHPPPHRFHHPHLPDYLSLQFSSASNYPSSSFFSYSTPPTALSSTQTVHTLHLFIVITVFTIIKTIYLFPDNMTLSPPNPHLTIFRLHDFTRKSPENQAYIVNCCEDSFSTLTLLSKK